MPFISLNKSFAQTYICLKSILLLILLPFSISLHHLWYQTTYQIMEEDIHQLSCFVGHHVCSRNSQSETDGNHLTRIYCTAIGWSLGDVIRTILTISNYINYIYQKCKIKVKIIIGANLRFSGSLWDIIIFRLVAYLLNMICLRLQILYKIAYIWISVQIWHSFISISRDRNIR